MRRTLFSVLCIAFALLLLSCAGASKVPSEAFSLQDSYSCNLSYAITFDAVIDGEGYSGLTHQLSAEGLVSLRAAECAFSGTLDTKVNEALMGSIAVESWQTDQGSYYRYDDVCFTDAGANSFRSVTDVPGTINFSHYTRSEHTETLFGTVCSLWMGTEIADNTPQPFVSGLTQGEVSLEGCLCRVTIWAAEDTGLPCRMEIDYSNLPELDLTFFDDDGNKFTITSMTYTVDYTGYGQSVNIELPEEMEAAPDGEELFRADDEPEHPDDLLSGRVTAYTGDPNADLSTAYAIMNADDTACFILDTPEYMELDEQQREQVTFRYAYDPLDVEFITYRMASYISPEEEAEYALSLPDAMAEWEDYSEVSASEADSVLIDGREVQYSIIRYILLEDGVSYHCLEILSWIEAPNGRDCLQVNIVEYNATGDGSFVDAEDELIYAYEALLGYGTME